MHRKLSNKQHDKSARGLHQIENNGATMIVTSSLQVRETKMPNFILYVGFVLNCGPNWERKNTHVLGPYKKKK